MTDETLTTMLAVVVGGVIIPIVGGIKKTVIVNWIRPEFLSLILAIGAGYGLSLWLAPGMPIEQVVQLALTALGGTSVIYGATKLKG